MHWKKNRFIFRLRVLVLAEKMASSTLYAMHVPGELATSAVRISLDESNTMAEIEQFMIVFNQLYQKFSRVINNWSLEIGSDLFCSLYRLKR